jgi:hypothetical protein
VTGLLAVDVAATSVPEALALVGTVGTAVRIAALVRVDAIHCIGTSPTDPSDHTNLQEGQGHP